MPFREHKTLLNLDEKSIECTIDTRNVIDLHGLWSIFHKCADAMENGKRLENLSWRLFSRETIFCTPDSLSRLQELNERKRTTSRDELPDLSSSVESSRSDELIHLEAAKSCSTPARPQLVRNSSSDGSGARKEKHITPVDLEKIVVSMKSRKALTPLSPLPQTLQVPTFDSHHELQPTPTSSHLNTNTTDSTRASSLLVLDSSTSTVATDAHSDFSDMSPPLAGSETTGTETSATSIVRGFSKDKISHSLRSQTHLASSSSYTTAMPGSILKNSAAHRSQAPPKKSRTKFHLGGSSGEGDSSFESSYLRGRSSLTDQLRSNRKTTSFNDVAEVQYQNEAVFDDTDDEDDDQSGSAIEDDDIEEEWEDDDDQSVSSSVNERDMFQRVDSKPNLVSRRSLLTTLMTEKDRAAALQNAASRSTPAIRRSRTSSPNGPLGSSPPRTIAQGLQASAARPIIMTTSNIHPPALSPRTTRRNMLSTELTESLRKHLLWDRQVNRSTTNAALKRRHTAQDMTKLRNFPGENAPQAFLAPQVPQSVNGPTNNYFDSGLQEYHQKGW